MKQPTTGLRENANVKN